DPVKFAPGCIRREGGGITRERVQREKRSDIEGERFVRPGAQLVGEGEDNAELRQEKDQAGDDETGGDEPPAEGVVHGESLLGEGLLAASPSVPSPFPTDRGVYLADLPLRAKRRRARACSKLESVAPPSSILASSNTR